MPEARVCGTGCAPAKEETPADLLCAERGGADGSGSVRLAVEAMGTRFEIVLIGEGGGVREAARLRAAGEAACERILEWHHRLNRFCRGSLVTLLNERAATAPVRIDADMLDLLLACRGLWEQTGGAFDITVGPLMEWYGLGPGATTRRFIGPSRPLSGLGGAVVLPRCLMLRPLRITARGRRREGEEAEAAGDGTRAAACRRWDVGRQSPVGDRSRQRKADPAQLGELCRRSVGMRLVDIDEPRSTVRFLRPGVSLDFGAVGKGQALDDAAGVLRECGVRCAFLHGGTSTAVAIGAPPGARGWRVSIADPPGPGGPGAPPVVDLRDAALSVSAPTGRTLVGPDGACGHVLDPRTGSPASGARCSAVCGPSARDADALSTAVLVLNARPASLSPVWTTLLRSACGGWTIEDPCGGVSRHHRHAAVDDSVPI